MKTLDKIILLFDEEAKPYFKPVNFNFQGLKTKKGYNLFLTTFSSANRWLTIEPTFGGEYKYSVYGFYVQKYTDVPLVYYAKNIHDVYRFLKTKKA